MHTRLQNRFHGYFAFSRPSLFRNIGCDPRQPPHLAPDRNCGRTFFVSKLPTGFEGHSSDVYQVSSGLLSFGPFHKMVETTSSNYPQEPLCAHQVLSDMRPTLSKRRKCVNGSRLV